MDLEVGAQAVQVLGHTAGVVRSGAADALDHVHAITALAAHTAVVLRTAEVHATLRHLRVCQPLRAPVAQSTASALSGTCATQLGWMQVAVDRAHELLAHIDPSVACLQEFLIVCKMHNEKKPLLLR